jgi:eukaryotic-like serine/threonine-protein kinase
MALSITADDLGFVAADTKGGDPPAPAPASKPTTIPVADMGGEKPSPTGGQTILCKERYKIFFTKPLPEFNSACADAFEAEEIGEAGRKCVAMICRLGMPVRFHVIKQLSGISLPGMMHILESGTIDWPETMNRRLAVIMPRPMGRRYAQSGTANFPKMAESDIVKLIAQPITAAIRIAADRKITLRNISVHNLFWEEPNNQKLVLQEGFTHPPAYTQPGYSESIHSAMCDPAARGEGDISDDIFSLGVLILSLATGKRLMGDMPADKQIILRQEIGSFETLVGNYAIPASIMEALRGLLADDPEDRWSLNDLESWTRGSRQAVKAGRGPRRSTRPFDFAEKQYNQIPALCQAFSTDWTKAAEVIRNRTLDGWLRRALADEPLADGLQKMTGSKVGGPRGMADDVLISRTAAILHPEGPIRFRNLICHIDGVGPALALAYAKQDQEKISLLLQLIGAKAVVFWAAAKPPENKQWRELSARFETVSGFAEMTSPGFGIERIIYELNPEMPCLSGNLQQDYIEQARDILPALNRLAQRADRPSWPIDRQIAAFIGARVAETRDADLRPLGPPADQSTQLLALLSLLAKMQRVYKLRELPHLCNWCLDILKPALARFKNIVRRQRITEEVQAKARSGFLSDIAKCADNEEEWQSDKIGFERAAMEHAAISLRIANLENMKQRQTEIAALRGERISVVIAAILAVAYFVLFFYLYFSGHI